MIQSFAQIAGGRTALQLVHDANRNASAWPECEHCHNPLERYPARSSTPENPQWRFDDCHCVSIAVRERDYRAALLKAAETMNPIPDRYATATIVPGECQEDAHNRAAMEAARKLCIAMLRTPTGKTVDGFGMYSAPKGPTPGNGTGKTWIAYGITRALRAEGIASLVYHVSQIDRQAKAAWTDKEKERAFFERLCTVPLLVIDDLGKQWAKSTGDTWVDSLLDEIVNERWLRCLPIVVTANFDLTAFDSDPRFRDSDRLRAVVDRLHGIFDGGAAWIELTGQSRRLRA